VNFFADLAMIDTVKNMNDVRDEEVFRVTLKDFEGPLDLLLHLIRKEEIDIRDIPVVLIADRYIEFIERMEEMNLDIASEYLFMAATLIYMKSRILLQKDEGKDQIEEEVLSVEDMKGWLIERLIEYQKYKHAAMLLNSLPRVGRDVFTPGGLVPEDKLIAPGLFELLNAYVDVTARTRIEVSYEIKREELSVKDRMTQIIRFARGKDSFKFRDIFEEKVPNRYEVVVTFIAILELVKRKLLSIESIDSIGKDDFTIRRIHS
jgi:segregation and condensation protein A